MWRRQLVFTTLLVTGLFTAVSVGSTGSFFSNLEQSLGNLFQAAEGFEFDLLVNGVDDPQTVVSITDLKPGDDQIVEKTVRVNGNQAEAKVYVHLKDLLSSQNSETDPETEEEAIPVPSPKSDIENNLTYDLTSDDIVVISFDDNILLPDAVSCWIPLGTIPQNTDISVLQSFHFDEAVTNWAQGDKLTFTEEFLALSTDAPEPGTPENSDRVWNTEGPSCVDAIDQVVDTYALEFTCTSGCSGTYPHTMNITAADTGTGNFSGNGFYNVNPLYTWNLTGNLAGTSISYQIVYTGLNPGYTVNATGNLLFDGSMSGTATGPGQTFTWTATKI